MYQRCSTTNITETKFTQCLRAPSPESSEWPWMRELNWVFSLGWENWSHPTSDNRATLNVQVPKNPCRGVLSTGVTSTMWYCYPTKGLTARKSCPFAGGVSFSIEEIPWKFTLPATDTETTFFSFPQYQLSTFEVFKTDQRTSPEPLGPTEMLKAEPQVWSVSNAAPQWNQFRKEGMDQFT